MKTEHVLGRLRQVAPGLSGKDLVPAFAHVFFTEDGYAVTYNDLIAMATPCHVGVVGGLPGAPLMRILGEVGTEVEFEQRDHEILVRSGRTKVTWSALEPEAFVFDFPGLSAPELPWSPEMQRAFRSVAVSMGFDPAYMSRIGVTLTFLDDGVVLYSTDNTSVTEAFVECDYSRALEGRSVLLPPTFVERFLDMQSGGFVDSFGVTDDYVCVTFTDGTRLWSKTGTEVDFEQFGSLTENLDSAVTTEMADIPMTLAQSLGRAALLLGVDPNTIVAVRTDGKQMVVEGAKGSTKYRDVVRYEQDDRQTVDLSPELLRIALTGASRMTVCEGSCILLEGPGFRRWVSIASE